MAVDQLLSKVQSSDEHLESNLTTMLQQVVVLSSTGSRDRAK